MEWEQYISIELTKMEERNACMREPEDIPRGARRHSHGKETFPLQLIPWPAHAWGLLHAA